MNRAKFQKQKKMSPIYLMGSCVIICGFLFGLCTFFISETIKDLIDTSKSNKNLLEKPYSNYSWLPLERGDIECVYTNFSIQRETNNMREVILWGKILEPTKKTDTWCSTSDRLKYYEPLTLNCKCLYCNCSDSSIETWLQRNYKINSAFNCSVDHLCKLFQEYFNPRENLADISIYYLKIFFFSFWMLIFLIPCAVFLFQTLKLYRESKKNQYEKI